MGVSRRQVEAVRMPQHLKREHYGDDDLAGQLRAAAQPDACLPENLHVIVDKPDGTQTHHQQQDQDTRGGQRIVGRSVRDCVANERRDHEDRTAHSRRPPLGLVRLGAIHSDRLPVSLAPQQPDEQRRDQQRSEQRDRTGQDNRLQRSASSTSGGSCRTPLRACFCRSR